MPIARRFNTRALFLVLLLPAAARALTLDHEKASHATLAAQTVTLVGRSELHLTGSGDPIPGSILHLDSPDSWVFFHAVAPSQARSSLLGRIRVDGSAAVADSNVRVVQHGNGSVVIPHSASFQPLEVFRSRHLAGPSKKLSTHAAYNPRSLGGFSASIRSFILKRGYTATFAANEDGTGPSRNFVAQDSDLELSILPADLDGTIRFIRVFPWRWTTKKGSCDIDPAALNAQWHYNWSISLNSPPDWEYVAIKQQPYWPDTNQDWKARGVNHLLGLNEPDNPVEDAYKNLSPQGSAADAVARMPELLGTGLRIGAPAVTDGGYGWIVDFMNRANAAGHRIDYVPVHYYRSYWNKGDPAGAANQMYNFLKGIHDATQRPIWVTEFNNGANWTDNVHDPSPEQNRDAVRAMIQMMDDTPWIERYAVYSRVEWFRQTHYDDGGITPMGAMYRDHVAPIGHLQTVPNTGLSGNAEFLFEDNTRDLLSGNNPLVYGTPKLVPGKHGNALSLDGSDDFLRLPGRFGDSNDFTFAGWVKWSGGGNWQRVFDFGNGTAANLFLTPKSGDNTLRFSIKNGGDEQQLNSTPLTPGVWTHVAVTLSGNTGKLFVNGGLVNTNTAMTINPAEIGTEANFLGKSQWPDPLFNGVLDDLRFFNSALPDSEIAALASVGSLDFANDPLPLPPAVPGLPYSGSLAPFVPADSGEVVFEKVGGPGWLSVSPDGRLTGVPSLADQGSNSLLIRVSNDAGAVDSGRIEIPVAAAAGLVARYPFDGSAAAAVGNQNGSTSGTPTYAAGRQGGAIDLDGTDDFVTLPAGIARSEEITVAAWVRWDGGGNWQRVFDFGNGTDQYFFLSPKSASNRMRLVIRGNGSEQSVETDTLATGQWVHLAATLDGTAMRLFVNGVPAGSVATSLTPAIIRPDNNLIGDSQFAADPPFNGRVDEFLIFNRELGVTEINALMSAEAPAFTADPIIKPAAALGVAYDQSLAGTVAESAAVFSKASGPLWLNVSPAGRLTGTPGPADSGVNLFTVRATAANGLAAEATVRITVARPPDLVAHFQFHNSTGDNSGAASGQLIGGPTYDDGLFDRAVRLDGVDDHVKLRPTLVNGLDDITVAARVRWDGGANWQRIFDFGNNTTQYMVLTPRSSSGTFRFTITTNGNTAGAEQILEAPALPTGEWVHVAVTLSGDTGTLFFNGVAVDSRPILLDPGDISPSLNYLGKSQWPDPTFNGLIDDFRIYNRGLSAPEIHQLAVPPPADAAPDGTYESWAAAISFPPGEDLRDSDPDRDRLANFIEWLVGGDPLTADPNPATARVFRALELGLPDDKTYLVLSARILKNRPATTLIPEAAATLDELGTPGAATRAVSAGPPLDDGDFEIFSWYYEVPIEDGGSGFMRLRVSGD